MKSDLAMTNLSFAIVATCLTLLVFSSWRMRTTPIGRGYLAFLIVADLWASVRLEVNEGILPEAFAGTTEMGLGLITSSLVLRLAFQASGSTARLPVLIEAGLGVAPALILIVGAPWVAALWMSFSFGFASIQMTRIPLRSWNGYRRALYATSGAMLLPGLVAVSGLAGAPLSFTDPASVLLIAALAVVLAYGLPRLGLLSSNRVQHSSVIEAMCDGVLVVDMNGRLVDFNEAARTILDLDEGEATLRDLTDALANHPDLVELFSGAIDGRTIYAPLATENGGQGKTYDLRLSALYDAAGSIQSRVLVLRDISDRIVAEEEHRRRSRHLRLVHEVSASVHEADTIEAGLEAALSLIAESMEFKLGHFLKSMTTVDGRQLVASGIVHCGDEKDTACSATAVGGPVRSVDRALEETFQKSDPRGVHWWKELGFKAALTLPVLIGPRLYGVFEFFALDSLDPLEIDESTSEMLDHVGELVGRAVERKLAEEKIRRLAFRDDLTGLPNRQRFYQLLRNAVSLAMRAERKMALLFMDLDGFKKVNDTLGHDVGDRLLAEVASRFSGVVRVSDHVGRQGGAVQESTISRLGGDEFTLLLTEIQEPADAALVASRLLATLEHPIVLGGQELFMSTSVGIAVFPDDGIDAESLLRNADAAMYFAKGRGRNGYQFYSEEMNPLRSSVIAIESRLRSAVEHEEFEVFYQPILNAETLEIVAAEALVRWPDGAGGFVLPDEFIPVAEETGLIVHLGKWVLRTACRQTQQWRDELGVSIRIGVNVSGYQIREPGMLEMVRAAICDTGVAPEQVELEITESTIMQDDALTVQTLRELKELGVGLALDDFGTGYSSLSYLRRFTIDRVKIDRSFVSEVTKNVDDAALTGAIIAMAHGLRLKVVAEGVETTGQALFLQRRGCDELQGYLFGRPCPAAEFIDLLRARPRTLDLLKEEESEG